MGGVPPRKKSSHGAPVTESPDPSLQHGARVPWLMFYKLPRGSCTNSVPIFPPCCMWSAWDYIPQLQLPQTKNSRRDDTHLTNPRTLRKIQIKEGRTHCSDLLASSVCAGYMLVKEKNKQHESCCQAGRVCYVCVCHQHSNGNLRTSLSLTLFLTRQLICIPNVIKGHLIGDILLIFKVAN